MIKSRLAHVKKHIDKLVIDVERGLILNRNITVQPHKHTLVKLWYKDFYYHELIAIAGGLDILNKTVDHVDGDFTNNAIHNLEAVSRGENTARAHAMGLHSNTIRTPSKISFEQREVIKTMYATGKYSQRTLAYKYGVSQSAIFKVLKA